jgi:heterotetrameric sarcosine oxidase gamma subunit
MKSQTAPDRSAPALQALSALGTARDASPRIVVADAAFHVVEEPFLRIASLRLSRRADRDAALRASPFELPQTPNRWIGDADRSIAHFEPNAWLLFGESHDMPAADEGPWLLTELSSRLASFRLRGARTTAVLASATAVSLGAQAFVRTLFAEAAPVLIQRLDENDYRVLIDVSFAEYLAGWLADAGRLRGQDSLSEPSAK